MEGTTQGQVTGDAAQIYEEFFVPALFSEWADRVLEASAIVPGDRVLDVGCGTGILARKALQVTGTSGTVVGLDPNEGMLRVAREMEPSVEWVQGRAERSPFPEAAFDAVVSQFALMFFEDPLAGISEMARVVKPSGRITVAVWDQLENSPGYAALHGILSDLFGHQAGAALQAPFTFGDAGRLRDLFARTGLTRTEVHTLTGTARFPSIRSWMHTDVRGWTLSDSIDDEQFELLVKEAEARLGEFKVGKEDQVAFATSAHIIRAIA